MSLIKCRCGRYTQNGFLCTNCQRDTTVDTAHYDPEEIDPEELDELDFISINDFTEYDEDEY